MALVTPEYLQTKQYSALRDRLVFAHGGQIQAGVWDPTDFKAVQRALGATMSVDVGAGFALVPANQTGNKGLYHIENDATVNVPISAAHATLPRVDQVVLTINDSVHGGASTDTPVLTTLDGTATSGATLTNRNGAVATLPGGTLRLADVLVGAAVSSITTANIQDRRPWARGAYRIGSSAATANSTVATYAAIDATNLSWRIECSGVPARVTLAGLLQHTGTNVQAAVRANWDGSGLFYIWQDMLPVANNAKGFSLTIPFTPTAGSHVLTAEFANLAATLTLSALTPVAMEFTEFPRQSASN